jgi:NAD(P)-dependent dehydrogenase (short-subunit alcohol dehydrogenase family)
MTTSYVGKVILVTGATSGLGRALVTLLAGRAAHVVGMARRVEVGQALEQELAAAPGTFTFVEGDVTKPGDAERAVAAVVERHGRLDALINNAANTAPTGRVENTTDDAWRQILEPDLTGPFYMCRAALPVMQKQQDGVIINIGSYGGTQGLFGLGAYGAAKAGLLQLTRVLAVENADRGVRANAVILGSVETEGWRQSRALTGPANEQERPDDGPLGRMRMQPEEAAKAIAVLCGDDARVITGAELSIDRGYSAGWGFATLLKLGSSGQLAQKGMEAT